MAKFPIMGTVLQYKTKSPSWEQFTMSCCCTQYKKGCRFHYGFTMSLLETWDWFPWCVPGRSDPRSGFVAAHAPAPHTDPPDAPADCNVHAPLAVVAVGGIDNVL